MSEVILIIGLLVFLAHLLGQLFRKTQIPDVLILVIFGMLIGPVFGLVTLGDFGKVGRVISTVALAVILFEGGTALDIRILFSSFGKTTKLTFSCFFITALLTTVFGYHFLGLSWTAATIMGGTLGGTSSAVVIPMVNALNMEEKPATVLVLESAITDVLSIVAVFALMNVALVGELRPGHLVGSIISSMLTSTLIGVTGGIGWLLVLRKIRDFPNTISSTLAYMFILYGITELLGFSGGIAALAIGITLTNYEVLGVARIKMLTGTKIVPLTEIDLMFYREAVFLLKTFFFVFLGISIRMSDVNVVAIVSGLIIAVFALRIVITRWVADDSYSLRDAAITSMMAPKGLAAAVLATLPLQYGIEGGETIRDVTYMAVLVSIVLCALLVVAYPSRISQKIYSALLGKPL